MVHSKFANSGRLATGLCLVLLAAPLGRAAAQQTERTTTGSSEPVATVAASAEVVVTREDLHSRADSLLREMSRAQDDERSEHLARRVQTLRDRLENGDFRPGDVVLIQVLGQDRVSGKVTVASDRSVQLPGLEERVDLSGLLYAEAGDRLEEALEGYVREPRVRVRPLTRVAVLGGVGRPGFYDVSPGAPLAEVVMAAGGPTGEAKLGDLEIRRGGEDLLADRDVQLASVTLEDLGVQRGDEIYVPVDRGGSDAWRWIGLTTGLLSSVVYLVTR